MFQMAVDRLGPVVPSEQILIITAMDVAADIAKQAPSIPASNFILEPKARGTAPVIALGALYAEWLAGGEAVIACLTADHYIRDTERFQDVLRNASEFAEEGSIVTLGITPTYPATGYGYIQHGDLQRQSGNLSMYEAVSFREKPDAELAARFLLDEQHTWNSGMFIWTTSRVREEFERQLPKTAKLLNQIRESLGTEQQNDVLSRVWPDVPRQTIDYGIMEGAENVSVIPVEIGWSDIGTWASLQEILGADQNGNTVVRGEHHAIDTHNTLVHAQRLVSTIGIENTIIVDTPDALLVCSSDRAQDVRQVVEFLRAHDPTLL